VTKIQKFEDLDVWKEGVRLSVEIYKSLGECKDYSLRDQIQRSAVSIPSNISRETASIRNKRIITSLAKFSGNSARTFAA